MTTTDTVAALRVAADLLEALPGLPPVYVTVDPGVGISLQFTDRNLGDDRARTAAVDTLAVISGADRPTLMLSGTYHAAAVHRGLRVHIYAPHVAREEVRPCHEPNDTVYTSDPRTDDWPATGIPS